MVAAIATINFEYANNDATSSFSIIEVKDAQAGFHCAVTADDMCIFTTADGLPYSITNAENN